MPCHTVGYVFPPHLAVLSACRCVDVHCFALASIFLGGPSSVALF